MPYQSFAELVLNTVKGVDYDVVVAKREAAATIVAIHGGAIEPPTGELACEIAGADHNLYVLRGLRAERAAEMRIPVNRFDEIRLRALLEHSQEAVALQGVDGSLPIVHLGGRNQALKRALAEALAAEGFAVGAPASAGAAHDPTRYYNLPTYGGVQVELTRALRGELRPGDAPGARWDAFVRAIRAGIEAYQVEARADLGRAMQRFERATEAMPPTIRKPHCHHD
ncbi:MAG: hypothetical protein GX557_15195 [Chloroflexi bacterium]|nr:hypothetical protein [Chloroflexota bacterium]